MVAWVWVLVAFLSGCVIGLTFPRLCPRCKMEKTWIEKIVREVKGPDGKANA
jgi:uncharacterized membrane-anchored protein YhcB (DUF1043 family)